MLNISQIALYQCYPQMNYAVNSHMCHLSFDFVFLYPCVIQSSTYANYPRQGNVTGSTPRRQRRNEREREISVPGKELGAVRGEKRLTGVD